MNDAFTTVLYFVSKSMDWLNTFRMLMASLWNTLDLNKSIG